MLPTTEFSIEVYLVHSARESFLYSLRYIGCKFRHELSSSCKSKYRREDPIALDNSLLRRTNISDQKSSFFTSTPKKEKLKCGKCNGKSQCEDEYAENYLANEKPEALES